MDETIEKMGGLMRELATCLADQQKQLAEIQSCFNEINESIFELWEQINEKH